MKDLEPKTKSSFLDKVSYVLIILPGIVVLCLAACKIYIDCKISPRPDPINYDPPMTFVTESIRRNTTNDDVGYSNTTNDDVGYSKPYISPVRLSPKAPFAAMSSSWFFRRVKQPPDPQISNSSGVIPVLSASTQQKSLRERCSTSLRSGANFFTNTLRSKPPASNLQTTITSASKNSISALVDNSIKKGPCEVNSVTYHNGVYRRYEHQYKGEVFYFAVFTQVIDGLSVQTSNAFGSSGDGVQIKNYEEYMKEYLIEESSPGTVIIKLGRELDHNMPIFPGRCTDTRTTGSRADHGIVSPIFKFSNRDKNNALVDVSTFSYARNQSLLDLTDQISDQQISHTHNQLMQQLDVQINNPVWDPSICKEMILQQIEDVILGIRRAAEKQRLITEKSFLQRNNIEPQDGIILAHSNGIIKTMERDNLLIRDKEVKLVNSVDNIDKNISQLERVKDSILAVDRFLSSAFFNTKRSSIQYTQTLVNRYLKCKANLLEFSIEKFNKLLALGFTDLSQVNKAIVLRDAFKNMTCDSMNQKAGYVLYRSDLARISYVPPFGLDRLRPQAGSSLGNGNSNKLLGGAEASSVTWHILTIKASLDSTDSMNSFNTATPEPFDEPANSTDGIIARTRKFSLAKKSRGRDNIGVPVN